jgi:hypothetical protein
MVVDRDETPPKVGRSEDQRESQIGPLPVESARTRKAPPVCNTTVGNTLQQEEEHWTVEGVDVRFLLMRPEPAPELYEVFNCRVTDNQSEIVKKVQQCCTSAKSNQQQLCDQSPWLTHPFLRVVCTWFGEAAVQLQWTKSEMMLRATGDILHQLLEKEKSGELASFRRRFGLEARSPIIKAEDGTWHAKVEEAIN